MGRIALRHVTSVCLFRWLVLTCLPLIFSVAVASPAYADDTVRVGVLQVRHRQLGTDGRAGA